MHWLQFTLTLTTVSACPDLQEFFKISGNDFQTHVATPLASPGACPENWLHKIIYGIYSHYSVYKITSDHFGNQIR
jgi:hypothetical protein